MHVLLLFVLCFICNYIMNVCECACVSNIQFYVNYIHMSGMRWHVLRYMLTNFSEDTLLPTSESLLYPEDRDGRFFWNIVTYVHGVRSKIPSTWYSSPWEHRLVNGRDYILWSAYQTVKSEGHTALIRFQNPTPLNLLMSSWLADQNHLCDKWL